MCVIGRRSVFHGVLWRSYARVYDALWDNGLTEQVATAVAANLPPSRPVVEVGAGTGLITRRLVATGAPIVAVEPHAGMRSRLARRLPEVTLLSATIESLQLAPREPRTVVAVNVVHLVPDPVAAVRRLQQLASESGTVVIVVPHRGVTVSKVARSIRRCGGSRWFTLRFVLLHALLGPLTLLAAPRVRASQLTAALASAEPVELVAGASDVLVLRGRASEADASAVRGDARPPCKRLRAAVSACVAAMVLLAACGSGPSRSTASFCDEFQSRAIELHDKYKAEVRASDPKGDPLGSLLRLTATALEAQGDMVSLFDALDQRAPDSIEPDVATMRDSLKSQAEAMRNAASDPLGALGGGLIAGLQAMGSAKRVDTFIASNCDLSFMQPTAGS